MYQNFYSSSDVQLYFSSVDHTRIIKVDTAISIGYSLRQTSSPIYSLGNRLPQFYSHGNTLGNGTITIAFTDEEYLKYILDYVAVSDTNMTYLTANSDSETGNSTTPISGSYNPGNYTSSKLGLKKSNAAFIAAANASAYNITGNKRIISIGAIRPLFNIKMYINNETAIRGSDSKVINLQGVKIVNETMSSSSTTDAPLMVSYNFLFKDVERG